MIKFLNKHSKKILSAIIILSLLILSSCQGKPLYTNQEANTSPQAEEKALESTPKPNIPETPVKSEPLIKDAETPDESTTKPTQSAAPKQSQPPEKAAEQPKENVHFSNDTEDAIISNKELTCTLSVRCDTILNNMAALSPEKAGLVPSDGVILAETTVTFYEGESVFNLLSREMKKNKIHLEFVNTPIYTSAYIEGIGNLYEFDCGELSGWMYKVNGQFPNHGCSQHLLKAGDKIEWIYTCDLGRDIGGDYYKNK